MNLIENIRLALSGLRASKMRALLTMLGIIIGIGSVIGIVTVGDSLSSAMTDQMSTLGVNNINVSLREKNPSSGGYGGSTIDDADRITTDMIEALLERYPDEISAVSLTQSAGNGQAKDGRLYANVSLSGVSSGYFDANNIDMQQGRFIADRDVQGGKHIAVVSDKLVGNLFGTGANALGQEIKIYTSDQILTFSIVGVYKYEAFSFMQAASDQDIRTEMYIPVTTAKRLAGAESNYQSFTLVSAQTVTADKITANIESFFTKYYGDSSKYTVSAMSMESMLNTMTDMLANVQTAIAAIAAISLLVGGIGVMNIMLVSVTERTREIGTRKALGAKNSAIMIQFIVESIIICVIGGIIGIGVGLGLGAIGAGLLGMPAATSLFVIVGAVLFSMAIGIFFGYYPAGKAAKLDPIEALRYE